MQSTVNQSWLGYGARVYLFGSCIADFDVEADKRIVGVRSKCARLTCHPTCIIAYVFKLSYTFRAGNLLAALVR